MIIELPYNPTTFEDILIKPNFINNTIIDDYLSMLNSFAPIMTLLAKISQKKLSLPKIFLIEIFFLRILINLVLAKYGHK